MRKAHEDIWERRNGKGHTTLGGISKGKKRGKEIGGLKELYFGKVRYRSEVGRGRGSKGRK